MTRPKARAARKPATRRPSFKREDHGIPKSHRKPKDLGTVRLPAGIEAGPRSYACKAVGTCMEPEVSESDFVIADPDRSPRPGDKCIFWIDGVHEPVLKVLCHELHCWPVTPGSEVVPIIRVRQINPTRYYEIRGNELKAVHPVIHVIKSAEA